jgi:hypothetical protein
LKVVPVCRPSGKQVGKAAAPRRSALCSVRPDGSHSGVLSVTLDFVSVFSFAFQFCVFSFAF